MKLLFTVLVVSFALAAPAAAAVQTTAATPALYKNCTAFNKKYRHGVGRAGARDRVRGETPPVTTFLRSTRIYRIAIRYNDDLDRDDDGVACEKR
jgi:hypothetical protein